MKKNPLVLVFCKNQIIGKVKSRLALKIGKQKALFVYSNLVNKTASIVIITHKSLEKDYQKCIKSFKSNLNIIKNPVLLRLF